MAVPKKLNSLSIGHFGQSKKSSPFKHVIWALAPRPAKNGGSVGGGVEGEEKESERNCKPFESMSSLCCLIPSC